MKSWMATAACLVIVTALGGCDPWADPDSAEPQARQAPGSLAGAPPVIADTAPQDPAEASKANRVVAPEAVRGKRLQAPASNEQPTKPFAFDAQPTAATATDCAFPSLVTDAARMRPLKVFAAGAYSGSRLGYQIDSSGNQAGRIDVAVNQPGVPVALMLGSYDPTVWHVGWAPGTRIVAVLVGGYHRQVVTGLPKDTPVIVSTYDNKGPCGYFYVTAEKAGTLNPIARRAFGRAVDMVYPAQRGRVVVGEPVSNIAALVTDASAQEDTTFRIAPERAGGEAGLAYAVSQGWLREARPSDAAAWLSARNARPQSDTPPIAGGRPAGHLSMHNAYVVLKSFELPPRLTGAHSATFFVPKGVKRPTGSLGHSVLYDYNTMTCAGILCDRR